MPRLPWFQVRRRFEPIAAAFRHALDSVSYLGPLRSAPQRHYLVTGGPRDTVGIAGEGVPQILNHRRELAEEINSWFERLEVPYTISIERFSDDVTGDLIALRLFDARSKTAVAQPDVGFGVGQLLPIIVEGLIGSQRAICVEQPEIHLHPRLQANIADLLLVTSFPAENPSKAWRRASTSSGASIQWIVETHSEALLLRIMRRMRETMDRCLPEGMTAVRPEDVAVLYVDPTDGGSIIREMPLNERGELVKPWPGGFFEEGLRELL